MACDRAARQAADTVVVAEVQEDRVDQEVRLEQEAQAPTRHAPIDPMAVARAAAADIAAVMTVAVQVAVVAIAAAMIAVAVAVAVAVVMAAEVAAADTVEEAAVVVMVAGAGAAEPVGRRAIVARALRVRHAIADCKSSSLLKSSQTMRSNRAHLFSFRLHQFTPRS